MLVYLLARQRVQSLINWSLGVTLSPHFKSKTQNLFKILVYVLPESPMQVDYPAAPIWVEAGAHGRCQPGRGPPIVQSPAAAVPSPCQCDAKSRHPCRPSSSR